jgi:hypothetical protein
MALDQSTAFTYSQLDVPGPAANWAAWLFQFERKIRIAAADRFL